ncbi:MAG: hypothetical protein ACJAT4_001069 [Granulosicoccus sp.]|jgi:hypothetical protein
MRKKITKPVRKNYFFLVFIIGVLAFSSCRKEDVPAPSTFTKEKREMLGDQMRIAIAADPVNFPILSHDSPADSAYWYIQKLYNQAHNIFKIDGQSPSGDRWDRNRKWQVMILDIDDVKTAFTTPGGHLYLSTGLLKSLEKEYELYYILTFEATLMHKKYLLNRLINEFNTTTLNNFVQGIPPPLGSPTLRDVSIMLGELKFDETMTSEMDEIAVSQICQTSIFDRTGIISIMDYLDEADTKWMQTRRSYDYRNQIDYILNLPVALGDDCGAFRSNGGYQKYILDRL